jgi:peroxiredoxin
VVGGSLLAFSAPIGEEGYFSITIPHQAIVLADNGLPSFLINITDIQNRLFAAHAFGTPGWLPQWAAKRWREKYETDLKLLVGQHISPMHFKNVNGPEPLVPNLTGAGPMLIVFWATWCGPCLQELKTLQTLLSRPAHPGTHVVTVSIDGEVSDVQEFLAEKGLEIPVYLDEEGSQMRGFLMDSVGTEAVGVPFTMVVDSDGIISFAKWGIMSKDELSLLIR